MRHCRLGADTRGCFGGVLAPNNKIYMVPFNSERVLVLDTVTDSISAVPSAPLVGASKWAGGVLAPNGLIYGIPSNSNNVLIIDPAAADADALQDEAEAKRDLEFVLQNIIKCGLENNNQRTR